MVIRIILDLTTAQTHCPLATNLKIVMVEIGCGQRGTRNSSPLSRRSAQQKVTPRQVEKGYDEGYEAELRLYWQNREKILFYGLARSWSFVESQGL